MGSDPNSFGFENGVRVELLLQGLLKTALTLAQGRENRRALGRAVGRMAKQGGMPTGLRSDLAQSHGLCGRRPQPSQAAMPLHTLRLRQRKHRCGLRHAQSPQTQVRSGRREKRQRVFTHRLPMRQRFGVVHGLRLRTQGFHIGPHALALAKESGGVSHLAEFGVVFLMFVIGLEFNLPKLRQMRHLVFGLGLGQVTLTIVGALVGNFLLVLLFAWFGVR